MPEDTRGTMDKDGVDGHGDLGTDEESARLGDINGPGGQGGGAVTSVQGEARVPKGLKWSRCDRGPRWSQNERQSPLEPKGWRDKA